MKVDGNSHYCCNAFSDSRCFAWMTMISVPLGARTLAPGVAATDHLETLELAFCGLGNEGVANLVPDGQVNRTLTTVDISKNGDHGPPVGEENVVALLKRWANLDRVVQFF
jgi:Leucine Rich repeat